MLLVIQSERLSLLDNVSQKDAAEIENTMREKVLETARFPEIFFVQQRIISLRQIYRRTIAVRATGFLSLHGETRERTIEAEAVINNGNIRAQGEFLLRQSDFNIEQVKALGGTLKVKDEVEISSILRRKSNWSADGSVRQRSASDVVSINFTRLNCNSSFRTGALRRTSRPRSR